MSDWELVENNTSIKPKMNNSSDWELVTTPNSQQPQQQESLGTSALKAIPRIGEDIARGGMGFIKNIPGYVESAKTEIPGLHKTLMEHPIHAVAQGYAGFKELQNKLKQLPLDISRYGSERLNLIPQHVTESISKYTPKDNSEEINKMFGQPQYPGEALIRGGIRNIPEILTAGEGASLINPLKYTDKNIAKSIVNAGEKQMKKHNELYNNLWSEADKSGINQVPIDTKKLNENLSIIQKYKTPIEYQSVKNLLENKSLSNAQKAQSDMGIMKRTLEDKSRKSSLTSEEIALHKASSEAEKHIEDNMFKNRSGKINQPLKDKYDFITNSYRENVVPYRYNSDIQDFKNKELLAKQLKQRLSLGEFAAKKGAEHPELFRGEQIKKALLALGIGGGALAGGKTIRDYLYGS